MEESEISNNEGNSYNNLMLILFIYLERSLSKSNKKGIFRNTKNTIKSSSKKKEISNTLMNSKNLYIKNPYN